MDVVEIKAMTTALMERGCGITEIAERLKVHRTTVSRWRAGEVRNFKIKNYFDLLNLYKEIILISEL